VFVERRVREEEQLLPGRRLPADREPQDAGDEGEDDSEAGGQPVHEADITRSEFI
jgi:hypothetical protein